MSVPISRFVPAHTHTTDLTRYSFQQTLEQTPRTGSHAAGGPQYSQAPVAPVQYSPPAVGEIPLSAERRKQLDDWFGKSRDAGPFGWFDRDVNGEDVYNALQGNSELGALTKDEQRYIVDLALNKWAPRKYGDTLVPGNNMELMSLAQRTAVDGSATSREVISERFVMLADVFLSMPRPQNDPASVSAMGENLAYLGFLAAGSGDAQAELINGMSPEMAGRIATALASRNNSSVAPGKEPYEFVLKTTLDALSGAPLTESGKTFIELAFAGTSDNAYETTPDLNKSMGKAIAAVWYPDDAGMRGREADRFVGILATDQGRSLIADQDVPAPARLQALTFLRDNPKYTGEVLARHDGSGWENPELMQDMFQTTAGQYLDLRGDEGLVLRGTQLDNTVGVAMGVPIAGVPENETPQQTADREAAAQRGDFSYYATGPNAEAVGKVVNGIRSVGGDNPRATVLPIQFSHPDVGTATLPLFRVETPDGQIRFVDNVGRTYENFEEWKGDNDLPPGTVTFPTDGKLARDSEGNVRLETAATPNTVDTVGEYALQAVDFAALIGGIIAGGALLIGSGGAAAPLLVIAGTGAWAAGRQGAELIDRGQHGQSTNPFTDEDARMLWFNLGASALSSVAAGNAFRLTRLAGAGRSITPLGATTSSALNVSANVADAGAIINTGEFLLTNWEELTPEQRAQMGLSMAFWGVSAAASTRVAGGRNGADFVNMTFNPAQMRRTLLETFAPPVVRDTQLPGNEVRIEYTKSGGLVTGVRIRAGERASQADIDLHIRVGQSMMHYSGLEGRMRMLFARNGEPPVGSRAWEANFEISKLQGLVDATRARLDNPALTDADRAQVQGDLANYESQLARYRGVVQEFETNWSSGLGHVDAVSGGRIRAQELGFPDRPISDADAARLGVTPEEAATYHWYLPPGQDTPLIRSRAENQARFAWSSVEGRAVAVAGDPARPTYVNDTPTLFNIPLPQQSAYSSMITARAQAISERDTLLARKDKGETLSAADEQKLKQAYATISEQSRVIGETGAEQYVRQTYPDAKLVYGGPSGSSQSGDFDQIWRIPGPDGDRFILVEAKGGAATLGTKVVGNTVETQGTRKYYDAILQEMWNSNPALRPLINDVRAAYNEGNVSYLEVKTPIVGSGVTTVKVREFDVAA
jgi:hypothetical protein